MKTDSGIKPALYWAKKMDWYVIPVNPYTKAPFIKDPFNKAAKETERIQVLFKGFDRVAYGVPCGPINGITIFDLDRKNGIDGLANFFDLGVQIPTTAIVSTPSAGYHLYFSTGNLKIPNSAGKIAPGVDVRGHGGYVLGPDCLTPKGKYEWKLNFCPASKKIAQLPEKLIELATCPKPKITSDDTSKSSIGLQLLNEVGEGQRNHVMASRIGYLLKKMDIARAWKATEHINENCCKPPLGQRELERTFRSILKRELRNE